MTIRHSAGLQYSRRVGSTPSLFSSPSLFRSLRLLMVAIFFNFGQPFAALAQISVSAPLPSAAQVVLNKGIIAAKVPDYPLAIRYFEEARKMVPQAPILYLNLGLAESRTPGTRVTGHRLVWRVSRGVPRCAQRRRRKRPDRGSGGKTPEQCVTLPQDDTDRARPDLGQQV